MPKKAKSKFAKKLIKAVTEAPALSAYILLDRSGSMGDRMAEALSSINTYVSTLAEKGTAAEVTVAAFDQYGSHNCQFSIVRKRQNVQDWRKLTSEDVHARGGTPLYDAIDRIVMAAEIEGAERTSIIIITDGAENASQQITREKAKALLDHCRARGWDVVFMGADFDAFAQAHLIGLQMRSTLNTVSGAYRNTMALMGAQDANYAATGMAKAFSASDRAKAVGKVQ